MWPWSLSEPCRGPVSLNPCSARAPPWRRSCPRSAAPVITSPQQTHTGPLGTHIPQRKACKTLTWGSPLRHSVCHFGELSWFQDNHISTSAVSSEVGEAIRYLLEFYFSQFLLSSLTSKSKKELTFIIQIVTWRNFNLLYTCVKSF